MHKSYDYVIIGNGIIGNYCAYYLLKAGFEVAVIDGESEMVSLSADADAHANIEECMNHRCFGNSNRWGGRMTMVGLDRHDKVLGELFKVSEKVCEYLCIPPINDKLYYIPNDDSFKKIRRFVSKRAVVFEANLKSIVLKSQSSNDKLVSDQLGVTYRKRLIVCGGGIGNAALLLNSHRKLRRLPYSGHLSGIIGYIKLPKSLDQSYKRYGSGHAQVVLSENSIKSLNKSSLLSVVNHSFSKASHRSFSLSLLYLVLSSKLGSALLSKPILKNVLRDASNKRSHFKNLLRPRKDDISFMASIFYQKFILRKNNPFSLLKNPRSYYPLHWHVNLDDDSGIIERDVERVTVNLTNKISDRGLLLSALDKQLNHLQRIGCEIQLNENFFEDLLRSSVDGYHQISCIDNTVVDEFGIFRENENIIFLSTGNFSTSVPHFPTFPALCLAHKCLAKIVKNDA